MSRRPGDDFHEVYERIMRLALVADQDSPGVTGDRDKAITSLQRLEARLAQVEAERDEARTLAAKLDTNLDFGKLYAEAESERDTLRAENERLKEALEAVVAYIPEGFYSDDDEDSIPLAGRGRLALRQENEKLREALERIAMLPNNGKGTVWSPISEALGIARAALDQPQEQE